MVLSFEVTSPAPIINASFNVSARRFNRRQSVTIRGSADVEFQLPDDFDEQKISYALTSASGQVLTRGEINLDELRLEDSASVSEVKFDKESYSPGDSAHLVVTIEGRSEHGYRLEVVAQQGGETTLLRDSRVGVYHEGKSIQEFRIEIPPETKGLITIEFKVFGNLTKKLFDSGVREIIVNDTPDDKAGDPVIDAQRPAVLPPVI